MKPSEIKKERKNLKMTQKELAETMGLSQAHLSLIEKGKRPLTAERRNQVECIFNILKIRKKQKIILRKK